MFFFVWFFVPETKGISLEAMDRLFGVTDGPGKPLTDSVEDKYDHDVGKEKRVENVQVA